MGRFIEKHFNRKKNGALFRALFFYGLVLKGCIFSNRLTLVYFGLLSFICDYLL